jgi:hypothetical protein
LKEPTGVRVALTMTTSSDMGNPSGLRGCDVTAALGLYYCCMS